MLEIANRLTESVACGLLTIDEAEKFREFLMKQRWQVEEAERKQQDDIKREERRKYWEAQRNEKAEENN